ncbi:hypothetical protein ACFKHW_30845 [Bradyrhizobium lupini]|uniref:hypothetical protein n=1 Tax=Rhizobium lupini TaxID=136996 RepID=UPI00366D5187
MNLYQLNLDSEQRQRLEELLKDNAALRDQILSPRESGEDRALRILSITRAFDRPMYQTVCGQSDSGLPEFDDLIKSPDVQRVPRADGKFWIREAVQNYARSYWSDHPEEYVRWAMEFVAWLEKNNEDPAERLALLLRFDVTKALRLLKAEFEKANDRDDLTLCHALTQQVEANLTKIEPSLQPEFAAIVARYRGRAWFLREFHRTVGYFPRRVLEAEFKRLIESDGSEWILYLSAPGGMGKTMFVQHMIARDLLKKHPFPFVARIDLDDIQVSEIAKTPWLVAIEIAEELDEQLTMRMFSEGEGFLSDVRSFSPLLYRRETNRGQTLTDVQRYNLRALASEQFFRWDGFISRCMELPRDRPLVVFIDTIEEASLHWPAEFRKVLERFEELRAALPQLRLILSGRYAPSLENDPGYPDRKGHFYQYDDKLKTQTSFVRLEPLAPFEAIAFIRNQLPDVGGKLTDIMVAAAAGNPFKLFMLCETVSKNPEMTAEQLKEYGPDVDVAYLIKRVIERIPVADELGLRWVLRYGAVPRRLTRSFLQDVLYPLLIDALSGKIEEAKEDIPSPKEREAWLKNADTMLDPEHLWERLSRYASDHSWISLQSKDPNTATLHPDVVKPMRRLLKQQPIFSRIHREAVNHFVKLKSENPDRWVELTLAEFYHRVQLGEDDVHAVLVKALDERPSPDDAAERLEILREIVKPDGDFSGAPPAALARAHYEIADAIAVDANFDYLPQDGRREDIRRNLEKAFELNRDADVELPAFAFKWRDFLDRNFPSDLGILADLWLVIKSGESRARYCLLLAEMYGQGRLSTLAFTIGAAIFGLADGRVRSTRIPEWAITERVAYAYKKRGLYRRAEDYLRRSSRKALPNRKHFERIQLSLVGLLVESSRLRDAEEEMTPAIVATTGPSQELLLLSIEISLLRRDAWAALAQIEGIADRTHFRFHQLRGRALGQLLRIDDAAAAFADATQAVLKNETQALLNEVRGDDLAFRLFEAELATEPASPSSSPIGAATEVELIRAFQTRGNAAACEKIINEQLSDRHSVSTRLRATIAGVTWGMLLPTVLNNRFIELLGTIDAARRLQLMEPPVLLGQVNPWRIGWFKRWELRNRLGSTLGEQTEMMDWVRYGRTLIAMGDHKRASAAFANIKVGPGAGATELAIYRQRCLGDPEAPAQPLEFWNGLASEPALYVAAVVENAQRATRRSERTVAEQCLTAAGEVLSTNSLHPVLAERHRAAQTAFEDAARPQSADHEGVEGVIEGNASTLADFRCVLLSVDAERISIEAAGRVRQLLSTHENESLSYISRYTRERTPRRLGRHFVATWPGPLEEMQEPFAGFLQEGNIDDVLLLALAGAPLVAVPWELSIPGSHVPIRIGNGRAEGPLAEEIRHPEKSRRLARLLSHLDQRSWSQPTIAKYPIPYTPSSELISQVSVLDERLLASHFFAGDDFAAADIIYIMTDIEDSPSLPEPCLPGGMTGELLGRDLQLRWKSRSRPFVVLHSPIGQGLSRALDQIFARNQLAQALVNAGNVSGVLATSLTSRGPDQQDGLLESLRNARNELDVMRRLRKSELFPKNISGLEEMLGLPATALFLRTE